MRGRRLAPTARARALALCSAYSRQGAHHAIGAGYAAAVIEVQGPVGGQARGRWTLATMAAMCCALLRRRSACGGGSAPSRHRAFRLDSFKPLALRQAGAAGIRLVRYRFPGAASLRATSRAAGSRKTPPTRTTAGARSTPPWKGRSKRASRRFLRLKGRRCGRRGAGCTGLRRIASANPTHLLAAFATAAATRYSGNFEDLPQVRYWQGLERAPNLSVFFNPRGFEEGRVVSPQLYRKLANAFSTSRSRRSTRWTWCSPAGLRPIAART